MTQLVDLKAIEARCEALSERLGDAAWTLMGPDNCGLFDVYDGDGNIVCCNGVEEQQDFIAHARSDIPALVAEVGQLRAETSRLRAEVAYLFHGEERDDEEE